MTQNQDERHGDASVWERMLHIEASLLKEQAQKTLERANKAQQKLNRHEYCQGRADTLGIDVDTFRALLTELSTLWDAESSRLSRLADSVKVQSTVLSADSLSMSEEQHALSKPLYSHLRKLGQKVRGCRELLQTRNLRCSQRAIVLAGLATDLLSAGAANLGEAQKVLAWLKPDPLGNRRALAQAMGLTSDAYFCLYFRLSRHHLSDAERLIFRAQQLMADAFRLAPASSD